MQQLELFEYKGR